VDGNVQKSGAEIGCVFEVGMNREEKRTTTLALTKNVWALISRLSNNEVGARSNKYE
jgi:hypothetical protein